MIYQIPNHVEYEPSNFLQEILCFSNLEGDYNLVTLTYKGQEHIAVHAGDECYIDHDNGNVYTIKTTNAHVITKFGTINV